MENRRGKSLIFKVSKFETQTYNRLQVPLRTNIEIKIQDVFKKFWMPLVGGVAVLKFYSRVNEKKENEK